MKKKHYKDFESLSSQLDVHHSKKVSEEDQQEFTSAEANKQAYMDSYC